MSIRPARRSAPWRGHSSGAVRPASMCSPSRGCCPGTSRRTRGSLYSPVSKVNCMVDVTIYTRDWCGYCSAAKRLLDEKGVRYTEHNATAEPQARQEMIQRANGRMTYPQIFVGEVHVGGCDDLYALDGQGRLDGLLATGQLN